MSKRVVKLMDFADKFETATKLSDLQQKPLDKI